MNRTRFLIAGGLAVMANVYGVTGYSKDLGLAFVRSIEERDEIDLARINSSGLLADGSADEKALYAQGPYHIPCKRLNISNCFKM